MELMSRTTTRSYPSYEILWPQGERVDRVIAAVERLFMYSIDACILNLYHIRTLFYCIFPPCLDGEQFLVSPDIIAVVVVK